MLHASSRVIKRDSRDPPVFAKKIAALVQRYRMREHLPYIFHLGSRGSDQIVLNSEPHLGMNKDIALQQQIQMLTHRPRQRVLHRNHSGSSFPRIQHVKHLRRGRTGQHLGPGYQLQRRLMAECPPLALYGDLHPSVPPTPPIHPTPSRGIPVWRGFDQSVNPEESSSGNALGLSASPESTHTG